MHPERTAWWLIDHIRDGFDIHHVDGNHANNDPQNLALIEHRDHMCLHGSPSLRRDAKALAAREQEADTIKDAYTRYRNAGPGGTTWKDVVTELNYLNSNLPSRAHEWAIRNGMPWPIFTSEERMRAKKARRDNA